MSASNVLARYYNAPHLSTLALPSGQQGSRFYATYNPYVQWRSGIGYETQNISFSLNRIKYNYTIYMTMRDGRRIKQDLPGEVIDLSHAHSNDWRKYKFNRHIHDIDFLQEFKFINNDLTYLSYSLKGHIDDTSGILFTETSHRPWLGNKYKKRINRIIIMATMMYFNTQGDYNNKLQVIEWIIQGLDTTQRVSEPIGDDVVEELYNNLMKSLENGIKLDDIEVHDFRKTCVKMFTQIYKALKAQKYFTQEQIYSSDTSSTMALNLEYPNIY